jgi:catechol 2,3-dioxygenase-like lactoylglutathione lyase family enzyme
VDVLSSRILLHPRDLRRSRQFYRDVLGLAVYREFGDPSDRSVVFFLGGGFLEVSGSSEIFGSAEVSGSSEISGSAEVSGAADQPTSATSIALWLQVRNVENEHRRLAALGVEIARPPEVKPWGLREMWITDPDGTRIVLLEVPEDHPLRRDSRSL